MPLWIFVLARIVSNPVSNVFQKLLTRKGATPLFIILATFSLLSLFCAPLILWQWEACDPRFWLDVTLCALLAVAGNVTLVAALQRSDLSVLGPINAYKSIVSLLPGILLLHEIPTLAELAGIALIIFGSIIVVGRDQQTRQFTFGSLFRERGVQLRFAALVFSAVEAVFLKRALLESTPVMTFGFWAILGFGCSAVVLIFTSACTQIRSDVARMSANWMDYAALAFTTGVMQLSTLITLNAFAVGPALALFQTSTILTVILGRTVFTEGHFFRRTIGSIVMIAGAVIIILRN
jgi:drug/metabolite transporter (DMT)-like permease